MLDRACEALDVPDAFDIQPESRDARIVRQLLDQIFEPEPGLIADRNDIADRERTMIEQQIQCDRAALADQRHAACAWLSDDLIRPECRALEEVDEAVAIGSEERQLA